MHFLAALENPRISIVLCLFEGVATGAADGWYRIKDYPASTLLHLGPGWRMVLPISTMRVKPDPA